MILVASEYKRQYSCKFCNNCYYLCITPNVAVKAGQTNNTKLDKSILCNKSCDLLWQRQS